MSAITRQAVLSIYKDAAATGRPYTWTNYQPINLPGYEETLPLSGRDCFDRLTSILQVIEQRFAGRSIRVVDWGCNLGFFCFELAKRGHAAVGIDCDARLVDICRFLSASSELNPRPRFRCDRLDSRSASEHGEFDLAICLSVLHHLVDDKLPTLLAFARCYCDAVIEMDGRDFGFHDLFPFYWSLREIGEANDRYGAGRRLRKLWHASNSPGGAVYFPIKDRNLVPGRGIFRRTIGDRRSVVKRELLDARHTWIRTNLEHEIAMYLRLEGSRFFPRLLGHGEEARFRWGEFEDCPDDGSIDAGELAAFFEFLRSERLYILDLQRDSFRFCDGRLKVVDLESVFPIDDSIESLIADRCSKPALVLDSYEKQMAHLQRSRH